MEEVADRPCSEVVTRFSRPSRFGCHTWPAERDSESLMASRSVTRRPPDWAPHSGRHSNIDREHSDDDERDGVQAWYTTI